MEMSTDQQQRRLRTIRNNCSPCQENGLTMEKNQIYDIKNKNIKYTEQV